MSFSRLLNEVNISAAAYKSLESDVGTLSSLIMESANSSRLTAIFGNGGSAADSQHWAAELVCTYSNPIRRSIPSLALTTDSSILTAWSNDNSFDDVFKRQLHSLGQCCGLAIGLSTSGTSKNVIQALRYASHNRIKSVLVSGNSIPSHDWLDMHIRFPSSSTPVIQTLTQLLYHASCELIDEVHR